MATGGSLPRWQRLCSSRWWSPRSWQRRRWHIATNGAPRTAWLTKGATYNHRYSPLVEIDTENVMKRVAK
jgi:hypothetical protein